MNKSETPIEIISITGRFQTSTRKTIDVSESFNFVKTSSAESSVVIISINNQSYSIDTGYIQDEHILSISIYSDLTFDIKNSNGFIIIRSSLS